MSRHHDLRRHPRFALQFPVRIGWEEGFQKFTTAKSLDVSEAGLRVRSSDRIPSSAIVNMKSEPLGLHGTGLVRYSKNQGMHCVVGIEFVGGLHYKPPAPKPDVSEPDVIE